MPRKHEQGDWERCQSCTGTWPRKGWKMQVSWQHLRKLLHNTNLFIEIMVFQPFSNAHNFIVSNFLESPCLFKHIKTPKLSKIEFSLSYFFLTRHKRPFLPFVESLFLCRELVKRGSGNSCNSGNWLSSPCFSWGVNDRVTGCSNGKGLGDLWRAIGLSSSPHADPNSPCKGDMLRGFYPLSRMSFMATLQLVKQFAEENAFQAHKLHPVKAWWQFQ